MAALAEIFAARGAFLSGSDVPDRFYTDAVLHSIGMKLHEGFSKDNIDSSIDLVLFSDAYRKDQNPELLKADAMGIPVLSYAEALGSLSRTTFASAVCGVHGKTTTTAMAGTILKALDLPATVIAGSAIASFGGSCTYIGGNRHLVAETDEYRGHFLHFSPGRILLTSVESDHQDYYPTYEDILAAFVAFIQSLPPEGRLVYCSDDQGARQAASLALAERSDIIAETYGFTASGDWEILEGEGEPGVSRFRVRAWDREFSLHMPGRHLIQDAVGALALTRSIFMSLNEGADMAAFWEGARSGLASFTGSKRRSEVLGEGSGILFVDDYAHHPTAIKATLAGYRKFWPSRRLVVDFMSHTYSRTIALMDEFASSFASADCVILHDIYASAREAKVDGVSGRTLFDKVKRLRPDLVDLGNPASEGSSAAGTAQPPFERTGGFILYIPGPRDDLDLVRRLLRPNDLFVTMGAGDNWKLGAELLLKLGAKEWPDA